ncbi:protein kinase [Sphaerospermopsis aphanizomenoides BCCUSP55]|uniref:serine/threonine-protein kinase n=1 Tax=Sphaerospermopsis aphanizomenoides TaxID=459663 RepID=UPI001906476C|nr:serine/threonine-protein kinase [Sphaerospermopsis aphanizomenoides]MBK1987148.1 protein kinase [Sphaerospermopsis aphanizomenoides BCCUSP55]
MSYCLNPHCSKPENPDHVKFCISCGTKLLLKERYRAIQPIGQGGFGRTFLAVDEDKPSKPPCVIKQFYPQAQGTNTVQKAIELFNQEAVQLDELGQHPQIPALLSYCTQDDRQYLVQEFINGLNLAQELAQNGAFNESQIQQLLIDLLPVLQFCHSKEVIHRDIKPENIIRRSPLSPPLKKGEVNNAPLAKEGGGDLVIVDFGAAKSATGTALNHTGTSIGSPEYVAPEQMRGRAIFASDIYSLGVTCINLLTGRSPFDSYDTHNAAWIWRQYLKTAVSNDLGKIIDKMVESIPSRRYQTTAEVLKDLNIQTSASIPPTIINNPVTQKPPIPQPVVSQTPSQIEKELLEVKTQFTGGKLQPQNVQPQPSVSTNNPTNKDAIDKDLEEMRAKFLGNG